MVNGDGVGSIVRLNEWYTLSGCDDEGVGFNVGLLLGGCDGFFDLMRNMYDVRVLDKGRKNTVVAELKLHWEEIKAVCNSLLLITRNNFLIF